MVFFDLGGYFGSHSHHHHPTSGQRERGDHGRIVTHSKHAITHSLCRRFHPWRPCGAIERSLLRKMYRRLNIYFPLSLIFVVLSLSIAVCVAVDLRLQGAHCIADLQPDSACLPSSSLIFQTKGHQKAIALSSSLFRSHTSFALSREQRLAFITHCHHEVCIITYFLLFLALRKESNWIGINH